MNERQYLPDASSEREAYLAPDYERFKFETSDLVQTSGSLLGFLGNHLDASTAKSATLPDSDW